MNQETIAMWFFGAVWILSIKIKKKKRKNNGKKEKGKPRRELSNTWLTRGVRNSNDKLTHNHPNGMVLICHIFFYPIGKVIVKNFSEHKEEEFLPWPSIVYSLLWNNEKEWYSLVGVSV